MAKAGQLDLLVRHLLLIVAVGVVVLGVARHRGLYVVVDLGLV